MYALYLISVAAVTGGIALQAVGPAGCLTAHVHRVALCIDQCAQYSQPTLTLTLTLTSGLVTIQVSAAAGAVTVR